MITASIDYDHHLKQQLAIEQWVKEQDLQCTDLCDFTDYVYTDGRLVTDHTELDSLYERWYYLMCREE